jgi:hypothetical protein
MSGCTRCWKVRQLKDVEQENEFLMEVAIRHYMGDKTDEEARGVAIYRVVCDLGVNAGRIGRRDADEIVAYQKRLCAAV